MIVQEDFLKKLRSSFDLNEYEVKIWTALLSRGLATAGELSDISNVPRSRSYDVLESLEKKGFVLMKLGKPIRYIAVDPEDIIKRVKKTIKVESDERLKNLDIVKGTNLFNELDLLYKNGIEHIDPTSLSGSVKGRNNIYNQIETMLSNAKKSVVIVTTSDGFLRKTDDLSKNFKKLSNGNIKVRIATEVNDKVKEVAKNLKNIEVRNLKENNARFVIVDSKDVLFMVNHDKEVHDSYDIGIWVKSPFFGNALENMFNLSWNELEILK
jgi:sugar-specific transcriptional regulator TrmB